MAAPRRAAHAGSWYSADRAQLRGQLADWLAAAGAPPPRGGRHLAVIAPHAGYAYSGPTAAFAYREPVPATVTRVFLLGPSHHFYLDNCALTASSVYHTPIADLNVDREVVSALATSSPQLFQPLSRTADEDEHSIEMHLPYIAHIMQGRDFSIVPIVVGNTSPGTEKQVGELLAPFAADPANFFVVSSDFCHWGGRFRYQRYNHEDGPIHASIEQLDRRGMTLIEKQDISGFYSYLQETQNTICGRHPIGVLLNMLSASQLHADISFTHYAQSSPCQRMTDSSVSYASAVVSVSDSPASEPAPAVVSPSG